MGLFDDGKQQRRNEKSSSIASLSSPSSSSAIEESSSMYDVSKTTTKSVLPLSMQFMRKLQGCCDACAAKEEDGVTDLKIEHSGVLLGNYCGLIGPKGVSPLVLQPMAKCSSSDEMTLKRHRQPLLQQVLADYKTACHFYHTQPHPSVLTTIRFSTPSLRVSTDFHEADMLALAEVLLTYGNGPLQYIRRLDFSKRKLRGREGFGSHGALTLAKVLQELEHVSDVFLDLNPIGPYGAAAVFIAVSQNPSITTLRMRRCRIGQGGGMAFAHYCVPSKTLLYADLSANSIGYHGCIAIDEAIKKKQRSPTYNMPVLRLDLEGNLVFQEIMNGVTHGLGVVLAFIGAYLMSKEAQHQSQRHIVSCGVYSTSLVVLYTSSTLYHSFFTMRHTKWIFEALDKCAIYILIAGSYTPFLQIVLAHEPMWSTYLLGVLWLLCVLGIGVEFSFPTWRHKGKFSLTMYLGMGWSTLVCLPEVSQNIPKAALHLMIFGGVGYTAGVPFFVRDNNLDHAIWHLFVMAGSIFHWSAIYFYVASRSIA